MLTKSNNSFHFFFFFLIKTVLIKLLYAKIAQRRQNVQRRKKKITEELMNKGRESLDVSLQAQDQSNKELLKEASSRSAELSTSSNPY